MGNPFLNPFVKGENKMSAYYLTEASSLDWGK